MDVARPIPDPQQLPGLRQMGRQRVVGLVLGMVGIEASFRAIHEQSRAKHRAVEIDRGPANSSVPSRVVGHLSKQIVQTVVDSGSQILQPVGDRPIGGQLMKPREAANDRILLQVRRDGAVSSRPRSAWRSRARVMRREP